MNHLMNNIILVGLLIGFIQSIVGYISTDLTFTCYRLYLLIIFSIAKAITYK